MISAYLWTSETENHQAAHLSGLSRPAVVYSTYRLFGMCAPTGWKRFLHRPQILGGHNVIAELDESLVAKRE